MSDTNGAQGNDARQNVLIVEDDVHIGAFLVEAINGETPFHALLVNNGDEAQAVLKTQLPGLMILDYHLPGLNGLQLYDLIHSMPDMSEVPAIMMSASLPERELQKRGIVGINKPFDLDDFLQQVQSLLV